ncbi:hypothetical protein ACET3Z_005290 [Daucus carota]
MVSKDAELAALVDKAKSGDHIDLYVDTVLDNTSEPLPQMQPHVIIRPRENIYADQKQMKRMYVTAHHLKQQQLNKKSVQVGKNAKMPTRKSPRLNKQQQNNEASATKDCASAKRKLVLPEPSHEDECMGDNQLEGSALPPPPPPPPLTPANKKFAMRIEDYDKAAIKPPDLKKKQKERVQEDSEDYVPEHTEELDDDSDSEVPAKKTKNVKKTKSLFGPTTRSRSNAPPVKDVTSDKEVNDANHEEHVPIQLPEAGGKGTVDDYMAMRKRQRENSVKAATTKKPPQPAEPSLADYEDGEENEGKCEEMCCEP